MAHLDDLASRRPSGGFSNREMLRDDREWAACFNCRKRHPLRGNNADQDFLDFQSRHKSERGCVVMRLTPAAMERAMRRHQAMRKLCNMAMKFGDNASVLLAFQAAATTLSITNFPTASSATAGWSSQWIDNSSNLYLEYLCEMVITTLTGSPANNQAMYFYTAGSIATATLPANTAGNTVANSSSTDATLTFLTIASNPTGFATIKVIPYQASGDKPNVGAFPCSQAYNGFLPQFLWWPTLNFTGQALTPTSIKVQGVYNTVA